MAAVLALALRLLRMLERERALREQHERQAAENATLLDSLQERQALLERLARIQRSISSRAPLDEVLGAITAGAADLLGDEVVGLRLIDRDDPEVLVLAAGTGISSATREAVARTPIADGIGGQAILLDRLVIVEDYPEAVRGMAPFVADGVMTAMAAPVREGGRVVGALVVASHRRGRQYSAVEQEVLLAFAEHASLALNDAKTVAAMNQAFDDAMHQALHDALTGLPNRALVLDRLEHALARANRGRSTVAVLFVDLDNFKMVNDSLGHAKGDELLVAVARRFLECLRAGDTAARLGGDEFAILLEEVAGPDDAGAVAERLLAALGAPFELGGDVVFADASIGVAVAEGPEDPGELLRNADLAMYRAKAMGKSRTAFFRPEMHTAVLARLELEADLRRALEQGELRVAYQPIVEVDTGRLAGVEALVRWAHPTRGTVAPAEFIPLAEECGLIVPLGRWVLSEACRQLRAWQDAHPVASRLTVSVNLSARQLQQADLVADVAHTLAAARLAGAALTLEITETVLMQDTEATVVKLQELKDMGVRVAIDDFGTGYSSLSYLRRFPVDVLKIDRSFVDGLACGADEGQGEGSLVHAIVRIGHTLGLQTIAEGVEELNQLERLRALGCPLAQGYLFARPLGADVVEELLASRSTLGPWGRIVGEGDAADAPPPGPQRSSPATTVGS